MENSKIVTVTLNPAVDKTYTAQSLVPGRVNRMDSVKNIAGGKGINVTKILRQYDYPVKAMGFLGGYAGSFIESEVNRLQAECAFTRVEQETRSSMNILGRDGYVTEILEPGPQVGSTELERFLEAYREAAKDSELLILSGSAAGGVPEDIYARLIHIAGEYDKKVLLDSSGVWLKKGVEAKPFMIKPNVRELEVLVGKKLRDREDYMDAALYLIQGGVGQVIVSMGAKGLLYVKGKNILHAKAPVVRAVNTVGCGDSVVASFAMSHLMKEDMEQTLRRAAAIAAANATTLESGVIPKEKAESWKDKIEIENMEHTAFANKW